MPYSFKRFVCIGILFFIPHLVLADSSYVLSFAKSTEILDDSSASQLHQYNQSHQPFIQHVSISHNTWLFGHSKTKRKYRNKDTSFKPQAYKILYQTIHLSNGLTVFVIENHRQPVVYIQVSYSVGAQYVSMDQSAWPHLMEHILSQMPNAYIQGLGGQYKSYVTLTHTNYISILPSQFLYRMLMHEKQRMAGKFSITMLDLTRSQQTILQESRFVRGDYLLERYIGESLFLTHLSPLPYSAMGTKKSLMHSTLPQLQQFYKQWYTPNNAQITIIGDVSYKKILPYIKKSFGSLPMGLHNSKIILHTSSKSTKKIINIIHHPSKKRVRQNLQYLIEIYYNIPKRSSILLLNRVLFHEKDGYITLCLQKKHLILSLGVYKNLQNQKFLRDSIIFVPWLGVSYKALSYGYRQCLQSLDRNTFIQHVQDAQDNILNIIMMSQDTIKGYGALLNIYSGYNGNVVWASNVLENMQKTKLKNLYDVFQKTFIKTKPLIVIVSSKPLHRFSDYQDINS